MPPRFLLPCFLLWAFAANTQAQKIEMQYFADVSEIEKIVVYHGFIWIKGSGALAQLDLEGKILQKYDLQNENISNEDRLLEGEGGEPFIFSVSQNALLRWDITQQKWAVFRAFGEKILPHNSKQQIWIIKNDSLLLLKNGQWAAFEHPEPNKCWLPPEGVLEQTSKGTVFYTPVCYQSEGKGFFWDGKIWQTINIGARLGTELYCYHDTLYERRNGYWDGQGWQPTKRWADFFPSNSSKSYYSPSSDILLYEAFGTLWYKDKSKTTPIFYKEFSLTPYPEYEAVRAAYVDTKGAIWLATNKGGIYKESGKIMRRLRVEQQLQSGNDGSQRLFIDKSGIAWLANSNELSYYENGKWQQVTDTIITKTYLSNPQLLQTESGILYLGSLGRIFRRMPNGNWEKALKMEQFIGLYLHKEGHLCVLGGKGEHYEILENGKTLHTTIPELKAESDKVENFGVENFCSPTRGEFWFASSKEKKLYQYKDGKVQTHSPSSEDDDFRQLRLRVWKDKKGKTYLYLGYNKLHIFEEETQKWSQTFVEPYTSAWHLDEVGDLYMQNNQNVFKYEAKADAWQSKTQWNTPYLPAGNFLIDSRKRLWRCGTHQVQVCDMVSGKLLGTLDLPQKAGNVYMYEGKSGEIWISGNTLTGILRLQLKE